MTQRPMLWRMFWSHGFAVGIALIATALVWGIGARRHAHDQLARDLESQAVVVRVLVSQLPGAVDDPGLRPLFDRLADQSATRFTAFDTTGRMIADTHPPASPRYALVDNPEVEVALSRRRGVRFRSGVSGSRDWAFVAVPLIGQQGRVGVVRAARPIDADGVTLIGGAGPVVALVLGLGLVAFGIATLVARSETTPIRRLRHGAERMTHATTVETFPASSSQELTELADALNQMAAAWNARIQLATRQRNEQEAVLASMVEGVLAVDRHLQVISMNEAAGNLIGVTPSNVQGKILTGVVRNSALQEFVLDTLHNENPVESEITLRQAGTVRIIQAQGARLRDAEGEGIGAVIVFSDITDLRRLERIRRDFVSNVSHELKTPITSIKGFVETLLDGALRDPDETRRFLSIVAKQSERLNTIIEDLLTLSRLEQDGQPGEDLLKLNPLELPLREAIEVCAPSAHAKNIRIELTCDPGLRARINPTLLEQCIVNLIDNAVKYSGPESAVSVEAFESSDEVLVFVRDQGCGISQDHLPRLFERFYRVDKARSRDLGGTGLGLSIVRHIVQSHHGRVTVESTPGIGSSFCIHLPKPNTVVAASGSVAPR